MSSSPSGALAELKALSELNGFGMSSSGALAELKVLSELNEFGVSLSRSDFLAELTSPHVLSTRSA